jgi:hypothetical protein
MLMCSTLCFWTPLDFLAMVWGGLANAMGSYPWRRELIQGCWIVGCVQISSDAIVPRCSPLAGLVGRGGAGRWRSGENQIFE